MMRFDFTADDLAREFDADVCEMYDEGYTIQTIVYILCTTEEEVRLALKSRR